LLYSFIERKTDLHQYNRRNNQVHQAKYGDDETNGTYQTSTFDLLFDRSFFFGGFSFSLSLSTKQDILAVYEIAITFTFVRRDFLTSKEDI
jgi:hypothetical protein